MRSRRMSPEAAINNKWIFFPIHFTTDEPIDLSNRLTYRYNEYSQYSAAFFCCGACNKSYSTLPQSISKLKENRFSVDFIKSYYHFYIIYII